MRALTSNEKLLLGILILVAFAGLNFFGYDALRKNEAAQTLAYAGLRADEAEAKVTLARQSLWQEREAWINQHEPVAKEEGDTKAQTLQVVLAAARGKGLQVLDQGFGEPSEDAASFRVDIALTVKGSMQAMAQWLAELQDPASFYAVPVLSLKADADQKAMVCTLHLYRYFRKAKA